MRQKVFVQGRGVKPVYIERDYDPRGHNFMAEEKAATKIPENKRGFHVRNMHTRTFFVARDNNFSADVFDANSFISCYLMDKVMVKAVFEDQKVNFYFNENNNTFYIEEEKFMKVNNKNYGIRILQDALHSIYKNKKKHISYTFTPFYNYKKGDSICTLTYKAIF